MDTSATTRRAERLCEMMNEAIRSLSPAERDRRLQRFCAQAKTTTERAESLSIMMNFVIARLQDRKKQGDDTLSQSQSQCRSEERHG